MSECQAPFDWSEPTKPNPYLPLSGMTFDEEVDGYLWGADPDEMVTIKMPRRNAMFYALMLGRARLHFAGHGGRPGSPMRALDRLSFIIEFAKSHGERVDVDTDGPLKADPR